MGCFLNDNESLFFYESEIYEEFLKLYENEYSKLNKYIISMSLIIFNSIYMDYLENKFSNLEFTSKGIEGDYEFIYIKEKEKEKEKELKIIEMYNMKNKNHEDYVIIKFLGYK